MGEIARRVDDFLEGRGSVAKTKEAAGNALAPSVVKASAELDTSVGELTEATTEAPEPTDISEPNPQTRVRSFREAPLQPVIFNGRSALVHPRLLQ